MRLLCKDLVVAFLVAAVVVCGFLGWLFYKQGNLRIDAGQDFSRISIGMAKADVQKLTNWDNLDCKNEDCRFGDLRRVYIVCFNDEGRVINKSVVFRELLPEPMSF